MKFLLLGAVAATLAVTTMSLSAGSGPLLSPRAAGNQIKHVSTPVEAPAVTAVTVAAAPDSSPVLLSPRAQGNLIKVVKGGNKDINPAMACLRTMNGTPKMVAECASHATMPGCITVAMDK